LFWTWGYLWEIKSDRREIICKLGFWFSNRRLQLKLRFYSAIHLKRLAHQVNSSEIPLPFVYSKCSGIAEVVAESAFVQVISNP